MGEKSQSTLVANKMSEEGLPSIEDFTEDLSNLPSIDDFLTEDIEEDLPSVQDFIEKKEQVELKEETQTIEDLNGNSFAEVKDIVPPWPELLRLINDIRDEIPDIPEIKSYDKELEDLTEQINLVRGEIPEVPEVRYYEAEIEAICEQIDLVKEHITNSISELPEVKYYDEQIDSIESKLSNIRNTISELPEVRYYESDIESLKEEVEKVRSEIPTFPKWVNEVNEVPDFSWIGKTFSVIDDDFIKVNDKIETVKERLHLNFKEFAEENETRHFENSVEFENKIENLDKKFVESKDRIWKELRESSLKIWEYHKEFKDDDRKLKKQIKNEYDLLRKNINESIEKYVEDSVNTDQLLLKYFEELRKEVSELPEVKYYDKDIESVRSNIKELYELVNLIKSEQKNIQELQEELQEGLLNEPPSDKESVGGGADPLTPMDQKFATLDDLASHYRLFINRIQQQISTIGGGGAGFIKDLDDVVFDAGIGTNKLLIYNGAQWVGIASTALSSTSDLNTTLGYGNTSSLGMSVGVITATQIRVGGATTFTEDLVVTGDARITGILTIGTATITLDPSTNIVRVGSGITFDASNNIISVGNNNIVDSSGNANYSGIVTAASIVADSATFSGNITVGGTITYDDVTNVDSIGIVTARSGVEIGAGSITTIVALQTASTETTTDSQTSIDTFSSSTYRSAQYQIQITRGSVYHVTTLNVLHDGTSVYLSEFGTIKTGASLASFDADIDSGNVRILATPSSTSSTTFKISKTLTKV